MVSRGGLVLIREGKGEVRRNFVNGVPEDLTRGFEAFRRVRSN